MKALFNFMSKIIKNRYMIKTMVVRDMKSRYAGAFLGTLWSFIHPLALIATYYFVFSVVFKLRLGNEYGSANFTIWLISGLLPWLFLSDTLSRATSSIVANTSLVTKTVFPSEILPLVTIISGLINHVITVLLLLVAGVALSAIKLSFSLFYMLPFMALVLLFVLGLSWLLSALNVYMRDVSQLVGIVLNLWFYFTPIVYSIGSVPERFRWILKLNPVLFIAEGYRAAILNKPGLVSGAALLYTAVFCIVTFGFGGFVFKRLKSGFGDVL